MNTVVFTSDLVTESDGLAWGLIFRAGEYPDKDFTITAAELADAAATFAPVPTDLEHMPTVLSGKLGTLEAVRVEGDALYGGVREAAWLREALGSDPRKVSATWDKASKRLIGLAYTHNPRIPDAQIVAAFTAFAGQRHSAADLRDLQTIHDLVVAQGAMCQAMYTKGTPMPEDIEKITVAVQPDPALAAMQAKFAAMEQQLADERMARFSAEGKQQAQALLGTKITPAQLESVAALFARLIADDHADAATVTFSGADKQPVKTSRVDTLRTILQANEGLSKLTGGQQISNQPAALFAMGDAGKGDEEAKAKAEAQALMSATPAGRAVLAKEGK